MGDFFNSTQFDQNPKTDTQAETSERAGSHVHVSLSQVANLTRKEEGLIIHCQKIYSITTIGVVQSVEELTTKNVYMLEDYTVGAPVEVQLWKNENDGKFSTICIFIDWILFFIFRNSNLHSPSTDNGTNVYSSCWPNSIWWSEAFHHCFQYWAHH